MKHLFFLLANLLAGSIYGQTDSTVVLETPTGKLYGTLRMPAGKGAVPVVLLIAGSGPTDRDGNNPVMKNHSLKMLAEGLSDQQIATLRFDKRGVGASQQATIREDSLRFDLLVGDAVGWLRKLKGDKRFSRLFIAGHSEGALIGMIAAQQVRPTGFISIAGAGIPASEAIREQLSGQPTQVRQAVDVILDSLRQGHRVQQVNPLLYALFRPSVQPYLISWFRYDPTVEIQKVRAPILIVQGTNDIQISVDQAQALAKAQPKARLVLIKNMNHVLKETDGDRQANLSTYNNPNLPVVPEVITKIASFVQQTR